MFDVFDRIREKTGWWEVSFNPGDDKILNVATPDPARAEWIAGLGLDVWHLVGEGYPPTMYRVVGRFEQGEVFPYWESSLHRVWTLSRQEAQAIFENWLKSTDFLSLPGEYLFLPDEKDPQRAEPGDGKLPARLGAFLGVEARYVLRDEDGLDVFFWRGGLYRYRGRFEPIPEEKARKVYILSYLPLLHWRDYFPELGRL